MIYCFPYLFYLLHYIYCYFFRFFLFIFLEMRNFMQIITLIYSIILLFFYHPLYQNYTSLMNTSFSFFYYIWCVLLTLSLCLTFFKVTSLKKFIIFLSLFFFIGLILPYHKNYPIFSTLHVFIPLSCIIIALLFLAYLIKNKQKSEPILAHKIYLWFSSISSSIL